MRDKIVAATYLMITLDMLSTILWIHLGLAIEANILMAWLLDNHGVIGFASFKSISSLAFLYTLRHYYHTHKLARYGLWIVFITNTCVVMYNMYGIYCHV